MNNNYKNEKELRELGYSNKKISRILFGDARKENVEYVDEICFRNKQSSIIHFFNDLRNKQEQFEFNICCYEIVDLDWYDMELEELEELEEVIE